MTPVFATAGGCHGRFRLWWQLLPAALCLFPLCSVLGAAGGPDHSLFTAILRDHVRAGAVNYRALKEDARLPQYLAMLQQTDPAVLTVRRERLAFWLNAYNAFTLHYVISKYPVKSLMNKLAYATGGGTFKTKFITINGVKYSLNDIENDIIRPMGDPRIHLALVCGAKSCPPLRAEAYVADRLEEQLEEQGRLFLSQPEKNRFDFTNNEIHLSKIFDWFKDDFRKQGGSELDFIARFLPAEQAELLRARAATIKVKYTEYDWSLNE
ncbi:MAG: DUF547 domain-containing protein [candidate division KSB1 bacterium]|nr:DUF547 domain-containing protein [candidate division KSB1 bacterium]MDZ7272653.1 DUF547 domain-containing protein [candidate division KSB1 bacterium]MDZ7284325.1 DUF547 domain-containing protein [candidate division KSB1 bacterium]MDZ7297279.1 DUF547 domain-containing protein [candidate division KSB1 bacterium]MDZ7309398.1 DUF547 domain-containing protein [candidate division KSB1 bacterium]